MKKLITLVAIIASIASINAQEYQKYIKNDRIVEGIRIVEGTPATFVGHNEIYMIAWNYLSSPSDNVDEYYMSLYCSQGKDTWSIAAGDKLYLGIALEDEYIELIALTDADPEPIDGIKYSIRANFLVPKTSYDKLYKGIDRLKITTRVNKSTPTILDVRMPFSAIEHMLMSYLHIMMATGR
jgi:benzoyl-CoA reductase/2-hydroxyglutaryl-CoA dehydratase subunit BcrC/BadD/HgdB